MAKKSRYTSVDIPLISGRTLFFDANVLIYLFFTTASSRHWQKRYSNIYRKLLAASQNEFIIDPTVISEVINRALREEHELYQSVNGKIKYKLFRDSVAGENALNSIHDIFENIILPRFSMDGKLYNKSEIECFMCSGQLDFNDKLITKLCEDKNHILLTNDKDFISSNIDILTANTELL